MEVDEFLRWMAFSSLEPFGEERQDWRHASLQALHANIWKKKGQSRRTPKQFLLKFGERKQQSMKEMELALMNTFINMGGKFEDA